MGIHERPKIWNHRNENQIGEAQERSMTTKDFVERLRVQAENYIKNEPGHATAFKSQFQDFILHANNPLEAAKKVAIENPHFQLDTLDDSTKQAAFLVALAQELSKPEYNH